MKKSMIIILTIVLLISSLIGWFVLMDPINIPVEEVGSIEVYKHNSFLDGFGSPVTSESEFLITDKNQIHYIIRYLNNLLPIPGEVGYTNSVRILTIRDPQGTIITEVKLPNNDCFITENGTFQADVGELNINLYNIENGSAIKTSMASFGLLLIGWLIVIVVTALAGMLLFLIQMGICAKTDSLALRLLPSAILLVLCLFGYRTQFLSGVFFICSLLAFNDGWIGVAILGAVAALSLILGWRQGHSMWKAKTANIE